ncbi:hypothetical protein HOD29_04650 [archaeon]|jgi:hypothetical protein|nr:hypothetical protein [archaeon]
MTNKEPSLEENLTWKEIKKRFKKYENISLEWASERHGIPKEEIKKYRNEISKIEKYRYSYIFQIEKRARNQEEINKLNCIKKNLSNYFKATVDKSKDIHLIETFDTAYIKYRIKNPKSEGRLKKVLEVATILEDEKTILRLEKILINKT